MNPGVRTIAPRARRCERVSLARYGSLADQVWLSIENGRREQIATRGPLQGPASWRRERIRPIHSDSRPAPFRSLLDIA
ncbi:hypothetical protein UA75_05835 [Actinoalloteichus sp. GBA129-24]|uniref:Uncharacterized protein n=1 Tax=Actinoalloteichus fjordicus TaxID=1612552 RepID=A0AAC9LB85_9PSEU|nr:hypothetical protein UA74_05830 [Actinoalloteichus fjordicus]APU19191.1 hypothetical protein UA75_05835 [Actinoalloteichus sp. GBA129-24]